MIGAVNPIDNPQAWDSCVLAGNTTPGRCDVKGFKRTNEYDVKAGKGTKGATETLKQQPPAKGTITFYAWRADQFAAWDLILPLIKYDPLKDKSKQAFDIYHPALADIEMTSALPPENLGIWEHDGGQMYHRDIEFLEYTEAPNANISSTANGSDASKKIDAALAKGDPDSAGKSSDKATSGAMADAQGAV